MSRTVRPLEAADLVVLPGSCATCLAWERGGRGCADAEDPGELKRAWFTEVREQWGSCGAVVEVEGTLVGYLTWVAAPLVPGSAGFAVAPLSPDAVQLVTGYVAVAHRRGGLGRVLVQAMAKDLLERGEVRAVEVVADARGRGRGCALPVDFLLAVGFHPHRDHPEHPRLRMDLRSTVTWRGEVEEALARWRGAVGVGRPSPARQGLSRSSARSAATRPPRRPAGRST